MAAFLQSGGSSVTSFEGFEGFSTLEGLDKIEDLVRFHDFPTPIPGGASPSSSTAAKQFQVLDLKINADFFGVDNLFSETKYQSLLDNLGANICLLDEIGRIIYTNKAWQSFSSVNGGATDRTDIGVNYLELCRTCTGDFVDNAQFFAEGLSRSISGRTIGEFCFEYPCDSDTLARWYTAKVFTFHLGVKKITVVAHEQQSEVPKTAIVNIPKNNCTMPLSSTSSSSVAHRPLVVFEDPLPTTKDFMAQFRVQTSATPLSSPTTLTSTTPNKKRKQSSLPTTAPKKLIFLSQGGPPEDIPSNNKIEIQREINFTESYLVLLRRKLVAVTGQIQQQQT